MLWDNLVWGATTSEVTAVMKNLSSHWRPCKHAKTSCLSDGMISDNCLSYLFSTATSGRCG